ncbi:MAG TPA: methyltransferase domain-containing protein [Kofleriaceae bacterium]|jgi:SAM-dependent methyltransferase|nr:methyltransferase domain-containing protein [Kofleriaceae bacterium]
MASAKQHYDDLLGEHYAWSVAGAGDPFERAAAWLARHDLADFARYLDLGAGFGAHAVPLARAGKAVTAVDFHAGLLAELHAAAPSVETVEADLIAFIEAAAAAAVPPRWDAVLCLGDTLTHLADRAAVQRLLAAAARILAPGGVLAVSYRDYSGPPRTGLDRFIPVRHDAHRALICCIDPVDADRVAVTDLVTTATPAGLRTQLGSYLKLRLAPANVAAWATTAGLRLDRHATDAGMLLQLFRAPS